MNLPKSSNTPFIAIGPGKQSKRFSLPGPLSQFCVGTGIAPMRSLIEERLCHDEQSKCADHGPTAAAKLSSLDNILFFGCRYHDKDYYYREEWEKYASEEKLVVFTAFSRDQVINYAAFLNDSLRRMYVRAQKCTCRTVYASNPLSYGT